MSDVLGRLRRTLPGISTEAMRGDNLAITLCAAFDDGDEKTADDSGWSEAARTGYDDVIEAIHAHYASTITALQERVNVLEGLVRGFAALQLTNVNGGTDNALMQTDRLTAAPLVLSARTALGEKQ